MDSDEKPRYAPRDDVVLVDGRSGQVLAVETTPYENAPGTATTLILLLKTPDPQTVQAPSWMVRPDIGL